MANNVHVRTLVRSLLALSLAAVAPSPLRGDGKTPLGIGPHSDYLCYYGQWDDETIFRAQDFDLVILEPSNITAAQVGRLKKGHDGIAGTADDVIVIGYLSVGEDHLNTRTGDGRGPCYYSYDSAALVYENKGYASWYVDDADHNGLPDADPIWKSAYVNGGDSLWWEFLRSNPNGADTILLAKGCDGLFLDLLDTATPWAPWPYRWTVGGMSDLVAWLKTAYPGKFLIGNRGLFYFDPATPAAYAHTIRPFIDGIMFESYYREGNRSAWAQKLNTEASKPDGFKVIALDYFVASDTATIAAQFQEVVANGWTDYVSSVALDAIHYDLFHRHLPDTNPPTWNTSVGIVAANAGDASVTLEWGALTDQSLPLGFDLLYTKDTPFDTALAVKVSSITPAFNAGTKRYSYTLTGLTNHSQYEFVVRVSDAAGNSEHNLAVQGATPPNTSGATTIVIDGMFGDWTGVPLLTLPPNPGLTRPPAQPADADFTALLAASDTVNLYVSYQVAGKLTPSYFYHVFIDADADTSTGYRIGDSAAVGADVMVEGNYLYGYTGTGGTNWSWASAAGLSKKDSAGRTELKIPRSVLAPARGDGKIRFLFNINSATSPYGTVVSEPADFGHSFYAFTLAGNVNGIPLSSGAPAEFLLEQNYPNPFNPATTIRFSVPAAGGIPGASGEIYGSGQMLVRLAVYDLLGREVAVLVDGPATPGTHAVRFSAARLASGCYVARLTTPFGTRSMKMLLAK
jgi:hypothetical protein